MRRVVAFDRSVDRRAIEAASRALKGQGAWNRERAIARVGEAMAVAKVNLTLRDQRLAFEPARVSPDLISHAGEFSGTGFHRLTPADLVDLVAGRIRLDTVLHEIVGQDAERLSTRSEPLTASALNAQLQLLGLPDAEAVTASFDWRGPEGTHEIRLEKPTVLMRLSGGDSSAVGRYFFCCDPRVDSSMRSRAWTVRWTDATGLALPPANRAEHLIAATLPAGTRIVVGVVADNFAKELGRPVRGGNTQIVVPERVTGLRVEHFVLRSQTPYSPRLSTVPTEVAVWHDDRLLRFRPEQN
jgi:hypothetical protein